MRSTLDEIQNKLAEIHAAKLEDLQELERRLTDAMKQLSAAEKDLQTAVDAGDVDAYAAAQERKARASVILHLYMDRQTRVRTLLGITEQESSTVIDRLEQYEEGLRQDFVETLGRHLRLLATELESYTAAVMETESTIEAWTKDVHPAAVRRSPFTGGKEATQLRAYLKTAAQILNATG